MESQGKFNKKTPEFIQQWQYLGPPHPKLLEKEAFENCKKAGLTSLQSYVYWAEIEKEPGKIDFSSYDILVKKLREYNLKWVPFLILGPDYATPDWFKKSKESIFFKCLEHNLESKTQSIWNPNLPKFVERFLRLFSEHYQDKNILESICLGISGNWGEAIYPSTGGFYENHTHLGFWCADDYALKSFQDFSLKKYGSLQKINSAWGTVFAKKNQIDFPFLKSESDSSFIRFLRKKTPAGLKSYLRGIKNFLIAKMFNVQREEKFSLSQKQIDFREWYLDSMNNWADFWLKIARRYFPNTKIYLVLGGDGDIRLGADFSKLTKIASGYQAGIRITNHTDDYDHSFVLSRLVSSAARFYNAYFNTEEGLVNKPKAVVMRIFDAFTSGAEGFYCKGIIGTGRDFCTHQEMPVGGKTEGAENLHKNIHYFDFSLPIIKIAVFFPTVFLSIYSAFRNLFYNQCAKLRDFIDFDFLDENLILDGALKKYNFFIVFNNLFFSQNLIRKLESWVLEGGVLVGPLGFKDMFKDSLSAKVFPGKEFIKYGAGYIIFFPKINLTFFSNIVYNRKAKYPWPGILRIDGEKDNVYASQLENKILYYNSNNFRVRKEIELEDRGLSKKNIEIEKNSIFSLPL